MKKLEKQLQQTQDCLNAAYVRITELQLELGRRSIKTIKSNKKLHCSRSHLNGNDEDHESTSLSSVSSPRKLSVCKTFLSNDCIPQPKPVKPVRDLSLPRSTSSDTARQHRTNGDYSRRNNFGSEDCLKRVTSPSLVNGDRLSRSKPNIEQNSNQPPRKNAVFSNNCRRDSSVSKVNEQHEPARQSSGYSSDTETIATLMRVSNALWLQRRSWASSSESFNSSDEDSNACLDRRDSEFSAIDLVFSPDRRRGESSDVMSTQAHKNNVKQNTMSPKIHFSDARQVNADVLGTGNGTIARRTSVFSPPMSSIRGLSNATQSNISENLKTPSRKTNETKVGSKGNRQHTSTPNLAAVSNRQRSIGTVQGTACQQRRQNNLSATNAAVAGTCIIDKLTSSLNDINHDEDNKGFTYRETNV